MGPSTDFGFKLVENIRKHAVHTTDKVMAQRRVSGCMKCVSHMWDVSVQMEMGFRVLPNAFPRWNAPHTELYDVFLQHKLIGIVPSLSLIMVCRDDLEIPVATVTTSVEWIVRKFGNLSGTYSQIPLFWTLIDSTTIAILG